MYFQSLTITQDNENSWLVVGKRDINSNKKFEYYIEQKGENSFKVHGLRHGVPYAYFFRALAAIEEEVACGWNRPNVEYID